MSENQKKANAKCPLCGFDFEVEQNQIGNMDCPSCGEQINVVKATKYYLSLNDNAEEVKEAHGEDYHKVMMLISESEDLVASGEYEQAEAKVNEALTLTDSDYRVFMAMVEVKTKGYTDLKDESHKEFLNRAISLADADAKKEITKRYKFYYMKTKLTSEELERYTGEETRIKKKKLEDGLKSLIPEFMTKEKYLKYYIILFPIFFAIGAGLAVLSYFIDMIWLSFIGLGIIVVGYLMVRTWLMLKEIIRAFNSTLDLYDVLDKLEISDEQAKSIYDLMKKLSDRFADNDPLISFSDDTLRLNQALLSLNKESVTNFIENDRFFSSNMPNENFSDEQDEETEEN